MDFGAALGGLVSGGMSILGGAIGDSQNKRAAATAYEREQRSADLAWERSKEAAKSNIQWRTEDAKAAGIHPLYALGAAPNMAQPMIAGAEAPRSNMSEAFSQAGQNISTAVARMQTTAQAARNTMEMKLLESQIGENDARKSHIQAQTAQLQQARQTGLGVQSEDGNSLGVAGQHPNPPGNVGIIDMQAPTQYSRKKGHPDTKAGSNPGYEERELAPGFFMQVPDVGGESPEEIFSEMSIAAFNGLIQKNGTLYGPGWIEDFMRLRYLGQDPQRKYKSLRGMRERPRTRLWVDPPKVK